MEVNISWPSALWLCITKTKEVGFYLCLRVTTGLGELGGKPSSDLITLGCRSFKQSPTERGWIVD